MIYLYLYYLIFILYYVSVSILQFTFGCQNVFLNKPLIIIITYPYMGTTRHFHVVFDVRVLDLNGLPVPAANHCCSINFQRNKTECLNISLSIQKLIVSQFIRDDCMF